MNNRNVGPKGRNCTQFLDALKSDSRGTALLQTGCSGSLQAYWMVIQAGADPFATTRGGWTVLHCACHKAACDAPADFRRAIAEHMRATDTITVAELHPAEHGAISARR